MTDINNFPGFLTIVFSYFVFLYAYGYFNDIKVIINYKTFFIILLSSILIFINNLYNDQYLKIPVAFCILTFFFYYIFNTSIFENMFLSFFIGLTSLVVEFILSIFVCLAILNISDINDSYLLKDCFSLICFWIYYFAHRIPFIKNIYKKALNFFEGAKKRTIYICISLFIIYFLYTVYAVDYPNIRFYIFSLIIIILISTLIIFYFREVHNNSVLNIKNKYLTENQIMYKNLIDDFRIIKHNLLNDFLFISTLCDINTQQLIKEKVSKYNFNKYDFNFFDKLPEGLQGILFFKSSIAQKKNIDFYLENNINSEIQKCIKLYIDLCEAISIALDNAIEASSNAKIKAVYINLNEDNNKIIIEILNTYSNDIDLDNIGNKNYSTKITKSGLGLYYIKHLNKDISIKTSFIFDLFKIQITAIK